MKVELIRRTSILRMTILGMHVRVNGKYCKMDLTHKE